MSNCMKNFPASLLITAVALAVASPAIAQDVSALKGLDTHQPVDVEADRIEVQDRQDRAVFSGNVHVRQGNLAIDAARLRVSYRKVQSTPGTPQPANSTGNLEILRIDADSGVHIRSPSENASGDYGIYDLDKRIITLLGAVTLTRGDTVLHGQRLVMDLNSGHSTLDGGVVGTGGGKASSGRVTGRFVVPQRSGN